MPDRLEERVRRALASTIRIIAQIGEGGMGVVYKGRHLQLDVDVAVKVLRPEIADVEMAERFRREAQLMARLNHRNIIHVLDLPSPDQVDGLQLFVMEYIDGTTLAERLTKERLPPDQARQLGIQLLDALAEVHRRRVVHRDIKPGNVVFDAVRGAWVLVDFGIAKALDTPTLSPPGVAHGTREYLPPDQGEWRDPTAQLDLYAAAATIYEAYTAEPWNANTSPSSAGWSSIPGKQAAALRRGIAAARDRWASAEEFREAFRAPVPDPIAQQRRRRLVMGVLAGIVAVSWFALYGRCLVFPDWCRKPVELGIAGFIADAPGDQTKATDLRNMVFEDLKEVLDTDPSVVADCAPKTWLRRCADGHFSQIASDSSVLTMHYYTGGTRELVTLGPSGSPARLGGSISVELLERLGKPALVRDCRLEGAPAGSPYTACRLFQQAKREWNGDNWSPAKFIQAVELNPALTDALWRLYTLQVWRREDPGDTLVRLIKQHRGDLPEMDGLLFDAQQAPRVARTAMFERVMRRFPFEALPPLLYGSELFHRGALSCIPLDSSAAVLRQAVRNDTTLTEGYDQLLWVLIRLGKQAAADSAFARYPKGTEGDFDLRSALQLAYQARFNPTTVPDLLNHPDPQVLGTLRRTFRFGLSLDIPQAERALGDLFAHDTLAADRADGHEGAGLSLLAMGMTQEGLVEIDSAASGDAGALEWAEWRVIPPALGVFQVPEVEREHARVVLRSLARSVGGTGVRAAFALALDAALAGDAKSAATWEAILVSQSAPDTVTRLRALLAAVNAGHRKAYSEALRLSQPLTAADESPQIVDPFARSVFHLSRGRWNLALGDTTAAACEWHWTDNADFQGWSTGPAQPAEVDWVLAHYARSALAGVHR